MAKIFKPRRALRSSVKSGSKRTLVLASGELMLVGKNAIGEGSKADLYLGDGVSQMQNLSPAMYGDTSEEDITITDDSSTTASAALGNVTTGATLGSILGSLKKAISLNTAAIATLNDENSLHTYKLTIPEIPNLTIRFNRYGLVKYCTLINWNQQLVEAGVDYIGAIPNEYDPVFKYGNEFTLITGVNNNSQYYYTHFAIYNYNHTFLMEPYQSNKYLNCSFAYI